MSHGPAPTVDRRLTTHLPGADDERANVESMIQMWPEKETSERSNPGDGRGLFARMAMYMVVVAVTAISCGGALRTETVTGLEVAGGQMLDVHFPVDGGPWPVVVLIHGAGLEPGNYDRFAELLAESGLVVFNADWRVLAPLVADSLGDIACAVRYAKDRAPEFGGEPESTLLVGHSTGAVYAGEIATNGDAYPGECGVDTSALTEGLALVAPAQVSGGRPWSHDSLGLNPDLRIAVIHGLGDDVVDLRIAVRNADLLNDAGYDVTTTWLDGGHLDLVLADRASEQADRIPGDHPARAAVEAIVDLADQLH